MTTSASRLHRLFATSSTSGLLQDNNGSILKLLQTNNRGTREKSFYQVVFGDDQAKPLLLRVKGLLCPFKGTIVSTEDPTVEYIKLKDMTHGFKHPCIMDVKIGRIGYKDGDNAKKAMRAKIKYPHMDKLGFQILGMRVYQPLREKYFHYDKAYGRSLDVTSMIEGLAKFFNVEEKIRTDVMYSILVRLQQILDWFEDQDVYHFYSSSLLFIYEAEPTVPPVGHNPSSLLSHSSIPVAAPSSRGVLHNSEVQKELDTITLKAVREKPLADPLKAIAQEQGTDPLQEVHRRTDTDHFKTVGQKPATNHVEVVHGKPTTEPHKTVVHKLETNRVEMVREKSDTNPHKRKKLNGGIDCDDKANLDRVPRNHEGGLNGSKSGKEKNISKDVGEGDMPEGDSRNKLPADTKTNLEGDTRTKPLGDTRTKPPGDTRTKPPGNTRTKPQGTRPLGDNDMRMIPSPPSFSKEKREGQNHVLGNNLNGISDIARHPAMVGNKERTDVHKDKDHVADSMHEECPLEQNRSIDKTHEHCSDKGNDCPQGIEGNGPCPHKGIDHCSLEGNGHCPHRGNGSRALPNGLTQQLTNCSCSCHSMEQGHQNSHKCHSGKTPLDDSRHPFRRQDSPRIEVRMIDFAHAIESTTRDKNYIFGLKMLMQYIKTLLDCHIG